MKIYLKYIVAPFVFLLCFSNLGYSSQCDFWNDEEKMRPYFQACQNLCGLIKHCDNCFTGEHINAPAKDLEFFSQTFRTPKYLFLETMTGKSNEIPVALYTPLGFVNIKKYSTYDVQMNILSKIFFESMHDNWKIQEVTNKIKYYDFTNNNEDHSEQLHERFRCPLTFFNSDAIISRIYLIKNFYKYNFINKDNINLQELNIYMVVYLNKEQSQSDQKLLKKLSSEPENSQLFNFLYTLK